MNRFSANVFSLIIIAGCFFASCKTTEQTQQQDQDTESLPPRDAGNQVRPAEPERPIPYPVEIPDAFSRALETGSRSSDGSPGEDYWQNEASYTLHAELDPGTHTLSGEAAITYYNHSPDELQVIVFELAQNLHQAGTPKKEMTEITGGYNLTRIAQNGQPVEETTMQARWMQNSSGYILDGTRLYLFPEENLAPGSSADFEFEWSFEIPQEGASGRMGRSRDNLYYIGYWYPQVAVYDDVYGWMDDPFTGNAEFYHGFADYDLTVTVPEEWLVMGTGELLNPEETLSERTLERYREAGESDQTVVIADFDELEGATQESGSGMLTWKFRAEKVMDVAFSATLESRWDGARTPVGDLDGDGQTDYTRIHSFYREPATLWTEQNEYARHSISFLSDYTGQPYPWPHMTSVEGAEIIGGGMEYPMMTIIGDYNNAGAVPLYGVTAHELAHMWFPMIVSTNERRYTWIDEGHTTFHTNQANIDFYGADRFDNLDVFGQYLQIAGSDLEGEMMRWSDFHYPGPAYGIASYPKPGSVLIALRAVLDDDVFLEAHREFIQRWKYKHPYPWDLFNTFEDVSGRDLSWFWRSWYYETWVLDQSIKDVYSEGNETVIIVEDVGNVPMPVHLRIELEDGSTLQEQVETDHWLQGFREKEIRMTTDSPVVRVEVNPGFMFPDVDPQNNVWEQ